MLLILVLFVSCTKSESQKERIGVYDLSDFANFEKVASDNISTAEIYVDTNTGVLYYAWSSGCTPLYNADGTLKNISEYDYYKVKTIYKR